MRGMIGALSTAMILYGVLQGLLFLGVLVVGLFDDSIEIPVKLFGLVYCLAIMAHGALYVTAGARVGVLRSRTFAMGVLLTAPLTVCTCYCSPLALGLLVFGLLVLTSADVKLAFEEAEALY